MAAARWACYTSIDLATKDTRYANRLRLSQNDIQSFRFVSVSLAPHVSRGLRVASQIKSAGELVSQLRDSSGNPTGISSILFIL